MIKKVDHLVITVCDLEKSVEFYKKLGFIAIKENNTYSLKGPNFMLKLHPLDSTATPVAKNVQVGSVDICFEIDMSQNCLQNYLEANNIKIELSKVARHGFKGDMISTYVRDPDGNLIELSTYPI